MKEHEVGEELAHAGETLCVAESCTGGLLAAQLTSLPGASAYFLGGVVAYSNDAKVTLLGVPVQIIQRHGGVSAQCTRAMSEGVRTRFGATYALAISGIAGPGGGTEAKPVGLVFIAVSSSRGTEVEEHRFQGSRDEIRRSACRAALNLLLRSRERR